ncbi:selenocysteine-specific elongation factor selB homologue, putative [Plasmodium sp. DRC-Itaito]|nr:selenocysteine-specific elongation factor selB homologue, putative [Plasmodium sp. DRC-Itaito]
MININVGVLGHVDSGKTSLCKCLSEVLSTCALDKHKESKERGITIDLGFSSFYIKKKIKNNYNVINHKREIQTNLPNYQMIDQNALLDYKTKEKNELHNILYDNTNIEYNVEEEEQQKYYDNTNFKHNYNNIYFYDEEIIQICLVDCPGHHSLLKSIIMGSNITDVILLVIDINKGIQKQTIECLVLCKIINCDIIIVLNKIDLIPVLLREKKINLIKKKIQETFSKFKSLQKLKYHIVSISANVKSKNNKDVEGDQQNLLNNDTKEECNTLNKQHITSYNKSYENNSLSDTTFRNKTLNIKEIINVLTDVIKIPQREISTYEDFYFLYDHYFNIKGKGTIFTGTVIKGKIKINCNVTILPINETGKVKEIQSFKKKVHEGKKGSRLSLLILNNNIKNIKKNERGVIVYETSNISYFSMFICKVKQVEFYKKNLNNSEHFICIIGFSSTECYGYFFKKIKNKNETNQSKKINYKEISQGDDVFPASSERILNVDIKFDRKGNYLLLDKLCYDDTQKGNNNNNNNSGDNNKNDHSGDNNNNNHSGDNNNNNHSGDNNNNNHSGDNNNNNHSGDNNNNNHSDDIYFLVVMKRRIHCFENEKCIFLKNDENANCRICLYGEIIEIIDKNCTHKKDDSFVFNKQPNIYKYEEYKDLKILKEKKKNGNIDKIIDEHTIICKNLFQSSNQVIPYIDKKIYIVKSTYDQKNGNTTHGNTTHGNTTHGNATHGNATHGNATQGNATHGNTSNILHTGTIIKPFAKQGKVIVSFDEDIFYLKNDFKSYNLLLVYYKDAFSKKKVFL